MLYYLIISKLQFHVLFKEWDFEKNKCYLNTFKWVRLWMFLLNGKIYLALLSKQGFCCSISHSRTHSHTNSSELPCWVLANRREQFGVQCLAQGHFNMWPGGDGDRTDGPLYLQCPIWQFNVYFFTNKRATQHTVKAFMNWM